MTDTPTLARRDSDKSTGASYVEWSAIFAGAFVASAIIVLMTAFGSAIGLSLVSPYKGHSPIIFYVALALWFVWIVVSSFVAGGYIAGRMRRPIEVATPHEGHVRDGVHGLVVWAVAVVIGAWLATWSISSVVKGGAELAKSDASSASSSETSAAPIAYDVDTLFRPNENAPVGKNGAADTSQKADTSGDKARNANDTARKAGGGFALKLPPNASPAPNAPNGESRGQGVDKAAIGENEPTEASRQEVSRILSTELANGSLSSDDHTYLVHLVAARAGISQADAEKRVDALSQQLKTDADKARKAGILLAFLTAATLVLGAGAAWWGASVGGRHRDEGFDASHLMRW